MIAGPWRALTGAHAPKVVLSYGMGVDSSGILLRWVEEPSSRDFALEDLLVISAQVGEEFPDIRRLVETHVLPRLRAAGVRYVQVARGGPRQADGVVVLSDTRNPRTCHIEGVHRLSTELLAAGTVPQVASGKRKCTLHFKAWPLDEAISQIVGGLQYRHVMGFNVDELKRVERDRSYSMQQRESEYPLVAWGWGRDDVEAYVRRVTGETWKKSACSMCCFAGAKAGMGLRYREFPEAAALAVFVEHVSMALNPRMSLYGRGRTVRAVVEADGNAEAMELFERRLAESEWALYRVRRIYYAPGLAHRKVEAEERGSRDDMLDLLERRAAQSGIEVETAAGSPRLHVRRRGETYPAVQEFLVPAPGVVKDKSRAGFGQRWREQVQPEQVAV